MTKVFANPAALLGAVGTQIGPTDWITIEQSRIDAFAAATGDQQWIHVDPVKARQGPFGTTIAHGYLTLSLINFFMPQLLRVEACAMGINYGFDKARFPTHVPVDSRLRGRGELIVATAVPGGVQVVVQVTVEREGSERPACVANTISRYLDHKSTGAT